MTLKVHPMKIDKNDPFESDLLDREEEIKNLTSIVLNVNTPAVLAIDSQWGAGKTTFIKMWEQYLNSVDTVSLYFNAWETDFSEDPLVSFLGEMDEGLKSLIGESKETRAAWSKTKSAGKKIAKKGIPALVKLATAGILDIEKVVEDELSEVMGSLAGDAVDDYLDKKNLIKEFNNSLTEFINSSQNEKPVVIFVDELDRCRPTYAISLLERIKHLFNIEGLVFVLALDKTQLCHSICAVYGEGLDAKGYLRRFIDFEYNLKQPEIKNYVDSLFCTFLLDDYFECRKKYPKLQYDGQHLKDVFYMLANRLKLAPREIEQSLANINLVIRTAAENEYLHPAFIAFLIICKNKVPEKYNRYITKAGSETELIDYLYEIVPKIDREDNFDCALIEGYLIVSKKIFNKEPDHISKHVKIIDDEKVENLERRYSQQVIDLVEHSTGIGHSIDLDKIIERISLISSLKFNTETV